ncbi:hypothetical protein QQP08_024030 [Theobroma cacao]|nr:hypothetical protein QQP08_024030 [Theobroma cacao]
MLHRPFPPPLLPPHLTLTLPSYLSPRSSSIELNLGTYLDEDEEEQEHDDAVNDEEDVEQIGNKTEP